MARRYAHAGRELRPLVTKKPMPRYRVMVDDNFHYMDENERYEHGTYDTMDEALAVCRAIVEQSLKHGYAPGMTAEALYEGYVAFGDDPFIIVIDGTDERAKFSAWTYAKGAAKRSAQRGNEKAGRYIASNAVV